VEKQWEERKWGQGLSYSLIRSLEAPEPDDPALT
jgi:hypothetical protein